jgi:hypothetical protein
VHQVGDKTNLKEEHSRLRLKLMCEQRVKKCVMHKGQTAEEEFREDTDRWSGEEERRRAEQ